MFYHCPSGKLRVFYWKWRLSSLIYILKIVIFRKKVPPPTLQVAQTGDGCSHPISCKLRLRRCQKPNSIPVESTGCSQKNRWLWAGCSSSNMAHVGVDPSPTSLIAIWSNIYIYIHMYMYLYIYIHTYDHTLHQFLCFIWCITTWTLTVHGRQLWLVRPTFYVCLLPCCQEQNI